MWTFTSSHVRSKHEGALPLIITHGWPGSYIEQTKVIDLLANPTASARRASAADAFHLVIPSIPGYGFSPAPKTLGWDVPIRVAESLPDAPDATTWLRSFCGAGRRLGAPP